MGTSTLVRILEAGVEIFSHNGPASAGTLEIAHKAGVAESTIFRRFNNKENLFHECVRTSLGRSLDPSHFRELIFAENSAQAADGFARAVHAGVKRWYLTVSVAAARLVLFTSLSSSRRWRSLGTERINDIIAVLAGRIEQEGRRRGAWNLNATIAATTLIMTLLYRKSTGTASRDRNLMIADTCIRQWIFGLFPEVGYGDVAE